MKNQNYKIAFLWLLIVIGFILHGYYHLAELFFGIDIKLHDAKGEVPIGTHLFRIVLEIFTLIFVLLSVYISKKIFYRISFAWAIVLGILNLAHLGGTIANEIGEISQVALLAFILATNILLSIELWKSIKINVEFSQ